MRQAWPIMEPTSPFVEAWHIGAICEHLEAVERGEIQRLAINVPPGHAKSLLVAVAWPAWVWTRRPAWRPIFASYSGDLALRDSVRCRGVIESPWYSEAFAKPGGWAMSSDQNVKGYFTNTASGARLALGVGGKATGFRGHAIVVDDPINATEAPSKLARDSVVEWWDKAMSTRLDDPRTAARVIIMQRLHEDDLTGHVLAAGGYEHLCLPSEFDPARRSVTCRVVTNGHEMREEFWRDPRTTAGELLFPALFPADVLEQAKRDLGSDGYAGQHQQSPTPPEGGAFRKRWWRWWRPEGRVPEGWTPRRPSGCSDEQARPLPHLDRVIISLDAAFKSGDRNDYVVFQVWGAARADRFLLDQVRGHLSFTETVAAFRRLVGAHPLARRRLVEDKANGSAVIDTLASEIGGIIPINPEGGKEARAAAVQPQIEAGNVYLPEGAPWADDFVAEFAAFPRGRHDDQVDACTQALLDFAGSPGASRARALVTM